MTPHKKESVKSVRLAQQARKTLGALYETVRRVTCREKKKQQAYAVTNSSEFKEGTTLTHVSSRIKRCKTGTRLLSPRIQLTMGNEVSGKCGRLLHLCGLHSSALKGSNSFGDQEHQSQSGPW